MPILSSSSKFSAGWLLLPAYSFSATMATTYSICHLGAVASLKFLAIENMPPHFSAHFYYGQTAIWIKIPCGMEVGLGPGNIVLDGDPRPPSMQGAQQTPTSQPTALARGASPRACILPITRIVD